MDDRPETMKRLMWEAFSARYSDAKPEELEWYPKLKAAWDDWTTAWCAGIEAHISTFDRTTPNAKFRPGLEVQPEGIAPGTQS